VFDIAYTYVLWCAMDALMYGLWEIIDGTLQVSYRLEGTIEPVDLDREFTFC
jgi:hypothetical protein